jgi:hypothetical protein
MGNGYYSASEAVSALRALVARVEENPAPNPAAHQPATEMPRQALTAARVETNCAGPAEQPSNGRV